MEFSDDLETLVAATLAGTGISAQRAYALACGADPANDAETGVAVALRAGFNLGITETAADTVPLAVPVIETLRVAA